MRGKLEHKEGGKGFGRTLKNATTILAMAAMLHISLSGSAQNVDEDRKVRRGTTPTSNVVPNDKGGSKNTMEINNPLEELKQVEMLKTVLFQDKKFGANYLMQYLSGMNSTSWDYLVLGDIFVKILYNLGYTSDNLQLLKYRANDSKKPFCSIGFVRDYKKIPKILLRGGVAVEVSNYAIDSSHVDIFLGGFAKNLDKHKSNKANTDSLFIPDIPLQGNWQDMYNYSVALQFVEQFFQENKDAYDITKRAFMLDTPELIKTCILEHFDHAKYLQHNGQDIRTKTLLTPFPSGGSTVNSLIEQKNGAIFTVSSKDTTHKYMVTRFGPDVYYTELNTKVNKVPGAGLRHNAFPSPVFDSRCEGDGNIDYLLLPFSARGDVHPTQIPRYEKNMPKLEFRDFVPLQKWNRGGYDYGAGVSMKGYFVNGVFVNEFMKPYPVVWETLALDDEGIMTHVILVKSLIDHKSYALYVFCGNKYAQNQKIDDIGKIQTFQPYIGPHNPAEGGQPGQTLLESLKGSNIDSYIEMTDTINSQNPSSILFGIKKTFARIQELGYLRGRINSSILSCMNKIHNESDKEAINLQEKLRKLDASLVVVDQRIESEVTVVDNYYDALVLRRTEEIQNTQKSVADLHDQIMSNASQMEKIKILLSDTVYLKEEIHLLEQKISKVRADFHNGSLDSSILQKAAYDVILFDSKMFALEEQSLGVDVPLPDSLFIPDIPSLDSLQKIDDYITYLSDRLENASNIISFWNNSLISLNLTQDRRIKNLDEKKQFLIRQQKKLTLLQSKIYNWRKTGEIPLDPDVTDEELNNNKID